MSIAIVVIIYTAITIFAGIFQCRPIKGAWDTTIDAHCIKINLVWEIMGGMNVLTDFALLLAPLPQLWKLQMPKETKLQLISIFCIGGLYVPHLHHLLSSLTLIPAASRP